MNEKTHRRIHIAAGIIIACLVTALVIILGPRRIPASVADRMEQFQTDLRAANQRADALAVQLTEVNGSLGEVGNSVGIIVVGVEHSQQFNSENLQAIADSYDASRVVEGSIGEIGGFIERTERFNSPGDP